MPIFPTQSSYRQHSALALLLACLSLVMAGCAKPVGGGGGGTYTPPKDYKYVTGNWFFTVTPITGAAPFDSLSGFIAEGSGQAGLYDSTTAVLRVRSSACYNTAVELPLTGGTSSTQVDLTSFPVDGQVLTLMGTRDASGTHLNATYSIKGGCADGAQGTLSGVLYLPLAGTYAGSLPGTPPQSMQLSLTQGEGSGDGLSFLRGSAAFNGFPCFTTGSLPYALQGQLFTAYVVGNLIYLDFTTNEAAGSHIVMTGTLDPGGALFTIQTLAINGGTCAAPVAATTLVLKQQ